MRLFSSLFSLLLLIVALVFALSNRQPVDMNLWPFDIALTAPLYLYILGSLFMGLIVGGCIASAAMLPHRMASRRLRGDIGALHTKLDTLQETLNRSGG